MPKDQLSVEQIAFALRQAIREALKIGQTTPWTPPRMPDPYDLCAKTLQRMADGG